MDNNRWTGVHKLLALKSALLFFEDDNARFANVTRLRLVDIRPGEKVLFAPSFRVGSTNRIISFQTFLVRPIAPVSWLFLKSRTMIASRYQKKIYSNVKEGTASTFSSLCFCCTGWNNESTERKAVPLNGVERASERERERREKAVRCLIFNNKYLIYSQISKEG